MPEPPDFDAWKGNVRGTPDFQQIARDVFMAEDYGFNPIPEIEEALRRIWNARGAADRAKLAAYLSRCEEGTLLDEAIVSVEAFDRALRTLDR